MLLVFTGVQELCRRGRIDEERDETFKEQERTRGVGFAPTGRNTIRSAVTERLDGEGLAPVGEVIPPPPQSLPQHSSGKHLDKAIDSDSESGSSDEERIGRKRRRHDSDSDEDAAPSHRRRRHDSDDEDGGRGDKDRKQSKREKKRDKAAKKVSARRCDALTFLRFEIFPCRTDAIGSYRSGRRRGRRRRKEGRRRRREIASYSRCLLPQPCMAT